MRLAHVFAAVLVLALATLRPASTLAQREATEGVVLAVGVQQGTLLLETQEGYVLAAVDPDATIDSPRDGSRNLRDLHAGDVVDYRAVSFAGMVIVRELHVVPVSFRDAAPGHEH